MAETKVTINELDNTAGAIAGAWTSFTPMISGISIGNGTAVGRYTRIGKTIHFTTSIVFGSTTTASGNFVFNVPAVSANSVQSHAFPAWAIDTGTAFWIGVGKLSANSSSFSINNNNLTWQAAAPFTWTNGDMLTVSGTYETA